MEPLAFFSGQCVEDLLLSTLCLEDLIKSFVLLSHFLVILMYTVSLTFQYTLHCRTSLRVWNCFFDCCFTSIFLSPEDRAILSTLHQMLLCLFFREVINAFVSCSSSSWYGHYKISTKHNTENNSEKVYGLA